MAASDEDVTKAVKNCLTDQANVGTKTPLQRAKILPLKDLRAQSTESEAGGGDPSRPNNLDVIIDEVKRVGHLVRALRNVNVAWQLMLILQPIDIDDSSFGEPLGIADSVLFDSAQDKGKGPSKANNQSKRVNQGFCCMKKHDGLDKTLNQNTRTIEILQEMAKYYDRIGDNWRTTAYRRAIAALRKQDEQIITKEQAQRIDGVGERLAAKIEEIVQTDTLRRLQSTTTDPNDRLLQLFMGIYGVGYPLASKWIAQGYRTLDELKSKPELTNNQRIGIEHYDDFLRRIPRNEVVEHAGIVEQALKTADPGFQMIIGGSYRRGADDCGDIDLIITKKEAGLDHIRALIRHTVEPKLGKDGFLKCALSAGSD